MASVRPVLDAERRHGNGEPLTTFGAFFGGTTGLMTHMKMYDLTINQSWFTTSKAKFTGIVLIGGGIMGGYLTSRYLFGDSSLRRLTHHHKVHEAYASKN